MTEVATWWYRPKDFTNFGDELGPEILVRLGYEPQRVRLTEAELVTVGSVLQVAAKKARPGVAIWGSGMMDQRSASFQQSRVLALRGPRSADCLRIERNAVPLGDPGLLVSRLWNKSPTKYQVGVVPHYIDKRSYTWADVVIDVTRPVDEVISQISSCATIASSSLHGMIVAQSFGIPAMRIYCDRVRGADFKWTDYIGACDRPVEQIQDDLLRAMS